MERNNGLACPTMALGREAARPVGVSSVALFATWSTPSDASIFVTARAARRLRMISNSAHSGNATMHAVETMLNTIPSWESLEWSNAVN